MSEQEIDKLLDGFSAIFDSFAAGLLRLTTARMAEQELMCAAYGVKKKDVASSRQETHADALSHLEHVSDFELDVFGYVTNVSYLIYLSGLLDTFISDASRFLF
ncbi:MAG: hypothetical protein ACM3TN_02590 [Alphaproteobacteria bacterium]